MNPFSHPLDQLVSYPFLYSRSVQPKVNKHRHVIKIIDKQLKQSSKSPNKESRKEKIRQKLLPNQQHTHQKISHQLLKTLDQGYGMGDPLCDAWIEYATSHDLPAQGMKLFNEVIESGNLQLLADDNPQIPQPLKDLFKHAMSKPSWYDSAKGLLACRALSRYPFQQGLVLQSISLMGGYCVPALAEPLLATGQLTDNVVGRIARTLCFLGAVTIPQGLDYSDELRQWEIGFKQTLKTRVIHSLVRHKIANNQYSNSKVTSTTTTHIRKWEQEKYGLPINQTDMIATNMSFSLTVIHGLTSLECDLSEAEREAILHLWRYVGHIIGIDDDLMPKTEMACNQWLYGYLATQQFKPEPASELAGALHQLPILIETSEFKGVAKIEQSLRAGITRSYWGNDVCDDLGLPKPKLSGVGVLGVSKMQLLMEQLPKSSPLTQQLMQKSAKHFRTAIKAKYLDKNPEIEPLFDEIFELAMRTKWE